MGSTRKKHSIPAIIPRKSTVNRSPVSTLKSSLISFGMDLISQTLLGGIESLRGGAQKNTPRNNKAPHRAPCIPGTSEPLFGNSRNLSTRDFFEYIQTFLVPNRLSPEAGEIISYMITPPRHLFNKYTKALAYHLTITDCWDEVNSQIIGKDKRFYKNLFKPYERLIDKIGGIAYTYETARQYLVIAWVINRMRSTNEYPSPRIMRKFYRALHVTSSNALWGPLP